MYEFLVDLNIHEDIKDEILYLTEAFDIYVSE